MIIALWLSSASQPLAHACCMRYLPLFVQCRNVPTHCLSSRAWNIKLTLVTFRGMNLWLKPSLFPTQTSVELVSRWACTMYCMKACSPNTICSQGYSVSAVAGVCGGALQILYCVSLFIPSVYLWFIYNKRHSAVPGLGKMVCVWLFCNIQSCLKEVNQLSITYISNC